MATPTLRHDHGIVYTMAYQPADRFWALQAIETGIFPGLAPALLALIGRWVTRRVA